MTLVAALDVSTTTSALCVVDRLDGRIVFETSVASEPDAIAAALDSYRSRLHLVGHEAGALAPWLHRELQARGLPMVMLETRHAHMALKTQRNKTDKNDARGLAQLLRTGWYKAVHLKSEESARLRLLLSHRRTLKRKLLDIENEVRQSLKAFGIRLGKGFGHAGFAAKVRAVMADDPLLVAMTECMLRAWEALWTEYGRLHRLVAQAAGRYEPCRRFMGIPGVGPVTSLAFKAAIDAPRRFRRSKTVGAHLGLTPRRIQSGDSIDFEGHISRCGDAEVRAALYEAAGVLLTRSRAPSALKAWGLRLARRRGYKRAVVAVARKLAVIMHRMWVDGTDFHFAAVRDGHAAVAPGDGTAAAA
jgi:transposase